jgi:hypothetical protein
MFAVILLGVGFIMLAAMFPVAIRQTQTTLEETSGSWLAQGAVRAIQQVATDAMMPPTSPAGQSPRVAFFRDDSILGQPAADALWSSVRGNLIMTQDSRFAWVPMYRRNEGDVFAQLIIIGVQSRNRPLYQASLDLIRYAGGVANDAITNINRATLEPKDATVTIVGGGANPDTVAFSGPGAAAVAEGAYIVIADDSNGGAANGYMYRIGNNVAGDTWELMPGNDLKGSAINSISGRALIIGRGYVDPANPANGYEGAAQDVCAYTTFIRLN